MCRSISHIREPGLGHSQDCQRRLMLTDTGSYVGEGLSLRLRPLLCLDDIDTSLATQAPVCPSHRITLLLSFTLQAPPESRRG